MVKDEDRTIPYSRHGNMVNHKYPSIANVFKKLAPQMILDGEIVALDKNGKPDFHAMQRAKSDQLFFYAFDVLAFQENDLQHQPLTDRRNILERAVSPLRDPCGCLRYLSFPRRRLFRRRGNNTLRESSPNSVYESGQRSGAWLKFKTVPGQELVIGGYLPGPHRFDALLVGFYQGSRLPFVGKLKNGFTPFVRRQVAERFKGLNTKHCPFDNLPESRSARRGKPPRK